MPPRDYEEKVMHITDLIKRLNEILEIEGDIVVGTHNDPYMDNQHGFPMSYLEVEENPKNMIGVPSYRNPSYAYKGKVLFID